MQKYKTKINEQEKEALIGFHAITGSDYISSIFRKGKRKCMETVKCLCDSWDVSELILKNTFAPFILHKNKTLNPARAEICTKKHADKNKIIDLSFLPQRESTLLLHVMRANYKAKLWKTRLDLDFTLPRIQNHGWLDSGTIQSVEEVLPEGYGDCLIWARKKLHARISDTETDSESEDNI